MVKFLKKESKKPFKSKIYLSVEAFPPRQFNYFEMYRCASISGLIVGDLEHVAGGSQSAAMNDSVITFDMMEERGAAEPYACSIGAPLGFVEKFCSTPEPIKECTVCKDGRLIENFKLQLKVTNNQLKLTLVQKYQC